MPAIGRAMPPALLDLLATRPVLLADGAMGTSLFAQGLATGDSPELWNLLHPERVRAVHRGFIEAGSDLILTNSFGANRCRLALHGAAERVAELNRAAAALARAEADRAGRTVLVAGSIGPTGEIFQPIGALAPEDGAAAFAEQAAALAAGGCDLLWIETLSAAEELQAAVAGAAPTGSADRRHHDLRHSRPDHDGPHPGGRHGAPRRPRRPAGGVRRQLRHRPGAARRERARSGARGRARTTCSSPRATAASRNTTTVTSTTTARPR